MNKKQAYKILGLDGTENLKEVKAKYRKIMHKVHPDTASEVANNDTAAKVNMAYQVILKAYDGDKIVEKKADTRQKKQSQNWKGLENPNAFADRPIYHSVEDADGESIGVIEIARGKYIWTLDEEFPLFLKSILETSKAILEKTENEACAEPAFSLKQRYLADLTYLLTCQFIDSHISLSKLATEENETFKLDAMAEIDPTFVRPRVGSSLYPAGVVDHKLYLRNSSGQIIGYLSFKDDRLYYVVIPLFELKSAQVKMTVVENKLKSRTKGKYVDIDLWIKLDSKKQSTAIESTTIQIVELLEHYKAEIS